MLSWTIKDLQKILFIPIAQAREVVTALQIQGYVKQAEDNPNEWLTTINGEIVSGSKLPRFSRESVEKAIASLTERIKTVNNTATSTYRITQAIAFGDFLSDRPQVQAADVGIDLGDRTRAHGTGSGLEGPTKRNFLRRLKARDVKINLLAYEPWMSERSHRNLIEGVN